MKTYAIYRVRYGEDFIIDSIESIINSVDQIFIFYTYNNFGGVKECQYKGELIKFPKEIDGVVDKIVDYINKNHLHNRIIMMYDNREVIVPDNQFTFYANNVIKLIGKPDMFMFIEHDMVWRNDQLELAISKAQDHICSGARQIELWRTLEYCIPERQRYSCMFWTKAFESGEFPMTNKSGSVPRPHWLNAFVHNFGFCISEKNMYWKHLLAIAFSKGIGDSAPNEDWYENKWLRWDLAENNTNLEISKGYESSIPYAFPYPKKLLPVIVKE